MTHFHAAGRSPSTVSSPEIPRLHFDAADVQVPTCQHHCPTKGDLVPTFASATGDQIKYLIPLSVTIRNVHKTLTGKVVGDEVGLCLRLISIS